MKCYMLPTWSAITKKGAHDRHFLKIFSFKQKIKKNPYDPHKKDLSYDSHKYISSFDPQWVFIWFSYYLLNMILIYSLIIIWFLYERQCIWKLYVAKLPIYMKPIYLPLTFWYKPSIQCILLCPNLRPS